MSPRWPRDSSLMGDDNFKTCNTRGFVSVIQDECSQLISRESIQPCSSSYCVAALSSFAPPCCDSTSCETSLKCNASSELLKSAGCCFSLLDTWTKSKEQNRAEQTTAGNRRSPSIHLSNVYLSGDMGYSLFYFFLQKTFWSEALILNP